MARAWAGGAALDDAQARELWTLVFGYREPWLRTG
jgi:hypothetical protein